MSLKDFVQLEKLGSGTYAEVYKSRRLIDQQIYALKKINMKSLASKQKNNALNQIRLLACLNSPYIISYCQSFFEQKSDILCIAMEYADGGDLYKKIKKNINERTQIPQIQIWKILIHLLYGINELHLRNILHRDLKSENVFISKGIYKIGDMNVSKIIKNNGMAQTQTGTPVYCSPEVWADHPYDQKCDIWSLGIILFEIAALKPPFQAHNMQKLFTVISKNPTPKIPKTYSKQLQFIINWCLQKNPSKRPSTRQLLQNLTVKMYENVLIDFKPQINKQQRVNLLKTIIMPKSKKQLNNQLPQSNYKSSTKNKLEDPVSENKQNTNQALQISQPPQKLIKNSSYIYQALQESNKPSQFKQNKISLNVGEQIQKFTEKNRQRANSQKIFPSSSAVFKSQNKENLFSRAQFIIQSQKKHNKKSTDFEISQSKQKSSIFEKQKIYSALMKQFQPRKLDFGQKLVQKLTSQSNDEKIIQENVDQKQEIAKNVATDKSQKIVDKLDNIEVISVKEPSTTQQIVSSSQCIAPQPLIKTSFSRSTISLSRKCDSPLAIVLTQKQSHQSSHNYIQANENISNIQINKDCYINETIYKSNQQIKAQNIQVLIEVKMDLAGLQKIQSQQLSRTLLMTCRLWYSKLCNILKVMDMKCKYMGMGCIKAKADIQRIRQQNQQRLLQVFMKKQVKLNILASVESQQNLQKVEKSGQPRETQIKKARSRSIPRSEKPKVKIDPQSASKHVARVKIDQDKSRVQILQTPESVLMLKARQLKQIPNYVNVIVDSDRLDKVAKGNDNKVYKVAKSIRKRIFSPQKNHKLFPLSHAKPSVKILNKQNYKGDYQMVSKIQAKMDKKQLDNKVRKYLNIF